MAINVILHLFIIYSLLCFSPTSLAQLKMCVCARALLKNVCVCARAHGPPVRLQGS
jgi:hypothetical protein